MQLITQQQLLESFFDRDPISINDRTRSRHWLYAPFSGDAATIFYEGHTRDAAIDHVPIATIVYDQPYKRLYLYPKQEFAPYRKAFSEKLQGALRSRAEKAGIDLWYSYHPGAIPTADNLEYHEGMAAVFNGVYATGFFDRMEEENLAILSLHKCPDNTSASAACRRLSELWYRSQYFLQCPYHKRVLRKMGGEIWKPEFRLTRTNMELSLLSQELTEEQIQEERALRRCVMFKNSHVLLDAALDALPPTAPTGEKMTQQVLLGMVTTQRNTVLMRRMRRRKRRPAVPEDLD